jgi:hypothetical protein
MESLTAIIGTVVLLACMLAGCAALTTGNVGKEEYESNCATCHGVGGKGDGPQALTLPIKPTDLTMLAKNNGGVFPAQRVNEIIDGRAAVAAHGSRTMPIWGVEFQVNARNLPEEASEEFFGSRDARVRAKVKALVDYLSKLQDMK